MDKICLLLDQMHDESEGALHYAKHAVHFKDSDRTLADTYINMARTEMEHFNKLQALAIMAVSENQAVNPSDNRTQAMYSLCEEHCLKEAAEAKILIENYR